ncbi:MAG: indole-3-glycerol-phosphate synthase [Deltaproteobacteria bacterium]|jgi:indole-3-glycerol phosphate synthase|nr:indole-3-glycerol-phosphate synthase [Deltaproteobacteria bacterium]
MDLIPSNFKPGFQKFVTAKMKEIRRLEVTGPPPPFKGRRADFTKALLAGAAARGLAIIAEYKRASPSKGDIDTAFSPQEAAGAFAGADVISVLTEKSYFKGELSFIGQLAVSQKPILRKDFIFHTLQIEETASTLSAAVLLIVGLLNDPDELTEFIMLSEERTLTPVVEVFDEHELEIARQAGAKVIQVNSRDFSSLTVDPDRALKLIAKCPPEPQEIWISASGLSSPVELRTMAEAGYTAVLVGTFLMSSDDKAAALDRLIEGLLSFKSEDSGQSSGEADE